MISLAVGGNHFPADNGGSGCSYPGHSPKPWTDGDDGDMADFWRAKYDWIPSWSRDHATLRVDYVRVYEIEE